MSRVLKDVSEIHHFNTLIYEFSALNVSKLDMFSLLKSRCHNLSTIVFILRISDKWLIAISSDLANVFNNH